GVVPRVLDEIACQILAPRYGVRVIGEEWNRSVSHGITDDPCIIHYHGGKHVLDSQPICERWKSEYWSLVNTSKHRDALMNPSYDRPRNLGAYLKRVVNEDLTVVTA